MHMHWYQFVLVIAMALTAWMGMVLAMRKPGRPTATSVIIVVLCLFAMIGAFLVGDYWNGVKPDDYMCHPGQHCTPWGD